MEILQDSQHFIHRIVKLEFYEEGDYLDLLTSFNIPLVTNDNESKYAIIDWNLIENKYSFFYDYEGADEEITTWLLKSEISTKPYLLTYFYSHKEIVKVDTVEFINNWNQFNFAVGFQGIVFISNDGKLTMEFTDDHGFQLISNFKIKMLD